ncbi:MAG: MtrB/PioB family decaheme-associated outer membrane protein [Candidatus Rokubacteria bacterium]|nr:MtrB/PioB family decaheme-associated outer membrane protein [Candidatus Rokubacteria bacterium]
MAAPGTVRLVVAAAVLSMCGVASAQTPIFGLKIEGDVELGGRVFIDEPSKDRKAKLEEYRDLSEQPFGAFRVRLFRPDGRYAVELGGAKIGQEDQEFFLSSGRPGVWNFGFEWDQTPHVFSTTGRLLATEPAPGVFTLPTPRPPLSAYNTARELDRISTHWDTARFSFTLTPAPDLDLKLEYTRIKKDGERPLGMAFGSPGNNFIEVLEPIDQTIHDFRIRASWVGDGWQLQAGYTLSIFENGEKAVVADNPCFQLAQCGGDATGPARGQASLAPDNMAHTLTLAGGVNLPMRTRVTANLSYSLRLQDADFLPHTINPAISSPLLTLPKGSLDGMVGTFLFNLNATTRPLPPLTLSAKYRLFDLDDMTDDIVFPAHMVNDRTLVGEARRAGRFDYTKHNADLDARWRFGQPVAVTVGGGWERWDRNEHREVPTSDEYFAKAVVDATPLDWMLARLSYRPSFRRISEYNTFAHLAHTVVEEEPSPEEKAQNQSVLLRKFDEGDRDRHRVDFLLQLTPTDVISITPTVSYRKDDYIDSPLGLQKAESWSAGFDLGWNPVQWLTLTAGYVYERIDQQQRSRNREVAGTVTFDFADFDWISDNVDTIHTVHAGAKAALVPRTLDWVFDLSYSRATGEVNTRNPVTPTSGTAAQRANATARPFPDLKDSLIRLETSFRYHFWKAWTASLGYIYEKFDKDDFRTDGLNPFVPGVTSIFLGNDLKGYAAHIVVMTLGYRFQ